MSFFDQVVGKLFGKQAPKSAFIHEVLSRSEKELEQYIAWRNTEAAQNLVLDIERAYHLKKQDIISAVEVHLLETQYANGFAVSFNQEFTRENFTYVFDYLKEKGLEQGYKLSQADRRILDKEKYEETIEKWYLKPNATDSDSDIIDQRYGNILIEKIDIDRKPSYIKFMANIYQDRLYTKAKPFSELIDLILNPKSI